MKIKLDDDSIQYIRDNKYLIDSGDWDEFFQGIPKGSLPKIYQFLYFEAGIDLLSKMSFIPGHAFFNCKYEIGNLVIPSNIDYIERNCFLWCNTLTSIDLSKTKIKSVPEDCFGGCDNLKKVKLPKSCEELYSSAFRACAKLSSINLESVKEIHKWVFLQCESLKKVNVSKDCNIGELAFLSSCKITRV